MEKQGQMRKLILLLVRLLVGGLFLYAGVMKARNPTQFLGDVLSYRLLPYVPAVALVFYLPWLEIISGACLVFKKMVPACLWILFGLLVVFTMALCQAWIRGIDVSCGCFGDQGGVTNYWWLVSRDLVILGMVVLLMRYQQVRKNGRAAGI